jgi:hypothetical protein
MYLFIILLTQEGEEPGACVEDGDPLLVERLFRICDRIHLKSKRHASNRVHGETTRQADKLKSKTKLNRLDKLAKNVTQWTSIGVFCKTFTI